MFILRLEPPMPVMTPKGNGYAIIFRDMGIEFDDYWTVVLDSGEVWTFRNSQIRFGENWTLGRKKPTFPE